MKRESLNAEETSMDEELLKPYIDNMIETQNEDLLMLSDFWGLPEPMKVKRGSVWAENEKKDELAMDMMEAEVDAAEKAAENPETEQNVPEEEKEQEEEKNESED